jgi:hypothetical protein
VPVICLRSRALDLVPCGVGLGAPSRHAPARERVVRARSGGAWLGACYAPSPAALRRDRTGSRRARPTRLAAVVASPARRRRRRRPRLSGELSPLNGPAEAGSNRSTLCCGCRHAASRRRAPALCYAGSTFMWQSGSSSSLARVRRASDGSTDRISE